MYAIQVVGDNPYVQNYNFAASYATRASALRRVRTLSRTVANNLPKQVILLGYKPGTAVLCFDNDGGLFGTLPYKKFIIKAVPLG